MKRKSLLRNLPLSEQTMTITRRWSWQVRTMAWLLPSFMCGALMFGAYDMGRRDVDHGLDARFAASRQDGARESRETMARATENSLNEQVRTLEAENARLKEELAYYNNLLPASTGTDGVKIQGAALEHVAPNQLRFRTLVMQGGNAKQRFSGQLQFVVTAQQNGETVNLVFPNAQSGDGDKFKVGFRHFQRLEGNLALPDGTTVKHVQVRVMENGQIRAQRMMEPYAAGERNS